MSGSFYFYSFGLFMILRLVSKVGSSTLFSLHYLGDYVIFIQKFFFKTFQNRFRFLLFLKQMEFVGNRSVLLVSISGSFVGAVIGLQLGVLLRMFNAEGIVGAATGRSLALELAPVMSAFIVTGRAGAASAAEIATMRVSEQIDAMESMGVDSFSYLVVPRVLASLIMTPILYTIFLILGIVGCFIFAKIFFQVDSQTFFQQMKWRLDFSYFVNGAVKAFFFGFIFSTIACYFGYHASGGAKGVGEATTASVVASLLLILVCDFIITFFQLG